MFRESNVYHRCLCLFLINNNRSGVRPWCSQVDRRCSRAITSEFSHSTKIKEYSYSKATRSTCPGKEVTFRDLGGLTHAERKSVSEPSGTAHQLKNPD